MIARGTGNRFGFVMDFHDFLHFFTIVNAQTMNDTISLCQRTEFASIKRALKLFVIFCFGFELFWMLGPHMEVQRLLLQETFFTDFTLMGQLLLVLFNVVVHRRLIALLVITVGTGKDAVFIFLIGDHGCFLFMYGAVASFFGDR